MPDSDRKFELDRKINLSTVVATVLVLVAVVSGFVLTQDKVTRLEESQADYELFQEAVEIKYVSHEQLQYIVVERIDRLDQKLERRLLELESKIQDQLTRIEEKIDE